jgi:hypothetical protein
MMARAEKSGLNYQDIMTAGFLATVAKLIFYLSKNILHIESV